MRANEFGKLLTYAIRQIAVSKSCPTQTIQDLLAGRVGRKPSAVEYWRKGHLPASHEEFMALMDAIVDLYSNPLTIDQLIKKMLDCKESSQ